MDLRAFGGPQGCVLGPDTLPEIEALHLAYGRLLTERDARPADVSPQMQLRPRAAAAAPKDFATALDEWERRKEYRTPAGEHYGRTYAKHVRAELGGYRLAEFLPPDGADRLLSYRNGIVAGGMAPNTVANRMSIVRQVLVFANQRLWLAALPAFPPRPRKRPPLFQWIEETHFRALRAEMYKGATVGELRRAEGVTDAVSATVFIERRRCYLSWLFYTGVHTSDADNATGERISLDMGLYCRHNEKSADHVPDEWFPLPEPLAIDLRALTTLLARPFYGDEAIFGGRWASVAHTLTTAAARLGIGKVNPRILRRSFAREMLKRGYTVLEVADMMGHVDTAMIRGVYARTPRPPGTAKSRWSLAPLAPRLPGAVLPFGSGARPALSSVPYTQDILNSTEQHSVTTTALTKKEPAP